MATAPSSTSNSRTAVRFLTILRKLVGIPYTWGGDTPAQGFDCSGLIYYALTAMGFKNVPRTSEEQWDWVTHINPDQLQPGDLVFFVGSDGTATNPGHVAIYLGNDEIEQAPYTGTDVQIDPFDPVGADPATNGIVGYGRIPGLSRSKAATVSSKTTTTTSSSTGTATLDSLSWGDLLYASPIYDLGHFGGEEATGVASSVAGDVATGLWNAFVPFVAEVVFVVFGLGLMGLGLYKIANPNRKVTSGIPPALLMAAAE